MKVSISGGGGLVGSMTAYALQCGGVVSSICLIDANKDMALGQATDLLHGASLVADQRISAGGMEEVASSNIVVITAGLRRKPDESRLDLINRNVDLFLGLLDQVKAAGLKEKDRKSTRLNSSHANISYAVFCLKKKKIEANDTRTRQNFHTLRQSDMPS